jgi:hypothetical protein
MVSRPTKGASMEELALWLAAAIYSIESETYLLIGSSEPLPVGSFGDETIGGVKTVARDMFEGTADPAFGSRGGGTSVPTTAGV